MQKTIVVEIEMRKAHPKYKRVLKSNKKFYAHDEQNSARVGDVVRIREARPLSKLKRWSLEEIVRRSSLSQLADEKTAAPSLKLSSPIEIQAGLMRPQAASTQEKNDVSTNENNP